MIILWYKFLMCLVILDKPFGLTFLHSCSATGLPLSYLKWFGEQPDGKEDSRLVVNGLDPSLAGTIEGGLKS